MTLNEIIKAANIETIRKKHEVLLKYGDKIIPRPEHHKCYITVLKEFNIDLKEYESRSE